MVTLRPHQNRAIEAMHENTKGQVIVPTGGGKTMIMIHHALQKFAKNEKFAHTAIIVAPRILLAQQLCNEWKQFHDDVDVMHVHSGGSSYFNTTDIDKLNKYYHKSTKNMLIFTTYHSLHKLVASEVEVDVIYYDEAHNSVQKNFFPSVQHYSSQYGVNSYYFTATPKFVGTVNPNKGKYGMNIPSVYGNTICNVPAPELVEGGSIVKPTIVPFELDIDRTRHNRHIHDAMATVKCLQEITDPNAKVVCSVGSSKVLSAMLSSTSLLEDLKELGYDVMHVTSKFGAFVNDKKVNRHTFIETLNKWGKEDRRFIVFHYSILSEGISVSGLTHSIMLRQLSIIEMAQTIGRVIRMNPEDRKDIATGKLKSGQLQFYRKSTGYVCTPVKSLNTLRRLERVVDDIFVKGIPPLPLSYK